MAKIYKVVESDEELTSKQQVWYSGDGDFGWVLTQARAIDKPIPVSGKLGLWELDSKTGKALLKQLG